MKIDSRIHLINQSNHGLSYARNVGLKNAHGRWVTFIDSDDVICSDYVYYLLTAIKRSNCECAICSYNIIFENTHSISANDDLSYSVYSKNAAVSELLSEKKASTAAWGKLALKQLWLKYEFPVNRKYEDLPITWKVIYSANQTAILENSLYGYRKRNNSITNFNQISYKSIKDYYTSIKQFENEFKACIKNFNLKCAYSFRICLESCRLLEMIIFSNNFLYNEVLHLLRYHMFFGLLNFRAPFIQRVRIFITAFSPRFLFRILHHSKMK